MIYFSPTDLLSAATIEYVVPFNYLVVVAGGLLTIIALMTWFVMVPGKALVAFVRFLGQFKLDWQGAPADAVMGRPGHPGVMARLQRIDGEMGRNGGSTLADQIHATARDVKALREQVPCLYPGVAVKEIPDYCPAPPEENPDA